MVRNNKVIVEILIPDKFFLLLLGIPPFTQNVGEGFRQPYAADAGSGLGRFEYQSCFGIAHYGWKHKANIPIAKCVHYVL